MKNLIWSAAAAFGFLLGSAGGAKAQFVYQSYYPNTVYYPPMTYAPTYAPTYVPTTTYYPNTGYVYTAPPTVSYYPAPTYYYNTPTYSRYYPYRTWGWYRY
jgi:hypothetical protein